MKKIAIITNFNITEKAKAAIDISKKLLKLGCELIIPLTVRDRLYRMHFHRKEFIYLPLEKLYSSAELVIVLGGDGSILEAARRAAPYNVPILGVNLGRLGYMAELEMSEINMLERITGGDFSVDERTMLSVTVNGETSGECNYALNDVVISNGVAARIIDFELYENGRLITPYRADGLIVATPTGSTAYSLSAGGPVVDPKLPCFCVTPICPHSLTARPVIFPDSAVLEIKNTCRREKQLTLTIDGKMTVELKFGDIVKITRAELTTKLIRIKEDGFYTHLRNKMNSNN